MKIPSFIFTIFILLILINTAFAETQITFMTYNIGEWAKDLRTNIYIKDYSVNERMERLANIIIDNNVDVVGLQEVSSQNTYDTLRNKLASKGYPMQGIYSGTTSKLIGKAILSKYPLEDYHIYNVPSNNDYHPDGKIQSVKIMFNSIPIRFFNVHLNFCGTDKTSNEKLLELMSTTHKSEYLILLGDFNSKKQIYSDNSVVMEDCIQKIVNQVNDSCTLKTSRSCWTTVDFDVRTDLPREESAVDHIFYEKNNMWTILDTYHISPEITHAPFNGALFTISDHLPLISKIVLTKTPLKGDFDGDGKNDIATFDYKTSIWKITQSSNDQNIESQMGWVGQDIPVPADYDGDGKTDMATYHVDDGEWNIRYSNGGNYKNNWGSDPTDIPVPADYDGDGKADIAVYRKNNATWYIISSLRQTADTTGKQFGWNLTTPVPGDYDGDGKIDIAVYCPNNCGNFTNAVWYILPSTTNQMITKEWGGDSTDVPMPGDYDGDGKTDLAVFRKNVAKWYIISSKTNTADANGIQFGWANHDDPFTADYDGDNISDLTIYRDFEDRLIIKYSNPTPPQVKPKICTDFTERYTNTQLNTHITTWKQGTISLQEIIKRAKINKYCN